MNARTSLIRLAAAPPLPTSFRLFVRGVNHTEKGDVVFDDKAARSVMAAYKEWGIDLPIDLEHQMLSEPGSDPTARDARGWCKLELRPDGSLWAVDVKWTPDGAARLAQKRQRYVSPAFEVDDKSRVTKMINVAITALPATHKTPALIAASARKRPMRLAAPNLPDKPPVGPSIKELHGALNVLATAVLGAEEGAAAVLQKVSELLTPFVDDSSPTSFEGDDAGTEGDGAEGVPEMSVRSLAPSERAACKALGCTPSNFLAVKYGRSFSGPLRRR